MATKQFFQRVLLFASVALAVAGCSPSGPGRLLEGARLIEQGNAQEALERLEAAREPLASEPRLWNYLGLAYHHLGRSREAYEAYQKALTLDINLADARYNLGWLYLEQENQTAALNEFITYVNLNRNSAEGWTRLGLQQLRLKRYDEAERSLNHALKLQPKNPAANNGLGMINVARRRSREATAQFNEALHQDADYAPAKLNLGVMALQSGDRAGAVQQLRAGLAAMPETPATAPFVKLLEDLDRQATPDVRTTKPATAIVVPATVTTAPTAPPPANQPAPLAMEPAAKPVAILVTNKPPAAAPVAAKTPTSAGPKAEPTATKPATAPKMEIVRVNEAPPVKAANDAPTKAPTPATKPTTTSSSQLSTLGTPPSADENRPGFWKRANPVRWFGSGRDEETNRPTTTTTAPKTATTTDSAARPTQLAKASTPPAPRPVPPSFARYDYKRPFPPRPGNRSISEKFLSAGLKLQRAGNAAGAVTEYSTAVTADPAHFEANYNLGLAAFEAGNYSRSLSAYEQALSIKPTDADARYNFALALDRAGYPVDAANELQTLLSTNDRYVNAHLTLANLYANRLSEPAMARKHYRKVLELDPKNAESVAIRYWLAANPG